jgi:hypothetical protein
MNQLHSQASLSQIQWQEPSIVVSCCEDYLSMYGIEGSMLVNVAEMHFDNPVARWFQSVEFQVR